MSVLLDLSPIFENQKMALKTLLFNHEVLSKILKDTIKNENGEDTNTSSFDTVKALAIYIDVMNDLNISFIKHELEKCHVYNNVEETDIKNKE